MGTEKKPGTFPELAAYRRCCVAPDDCFGSWLCENSGARRAGRNIWKKLRIIESNRAARAMCGTLLENYIFYISPMYEFLHSQGQTRPNWPRRHIHFMSAVPPIPTINSICRCR